MAIILLLASIVNAWFAYRWWQAILPYVRSQLDGASGAAVSERASVLELIILGITALLWCAYEVPAHAHQGQTPGKRLLNIKVLPVEGTGPIGVRRAWRRWSPIGLPTVLWGFCCVGFVLQFFAALPVFTDRLLRQGAHDKRAQTVVVQIDGSTPQPTEGNHEPADQSRS